MKLQEIRAVVSRHMGIDTLNAMQSAAAASDASRVVLLSPTGSGKTLAFVIAMLRRINPEKTGATPSPEAIVIAPSRELVRQIVDIVRPLGAAFCLKTVALYGGNAFADEAASIKGALPDIVVATPGRLLDHIERGSLDVSQTRQLVLDEYDKTLALGFHEQMRAISRQVAAKLPGRVPRFAMVTSATEATDLPDFISLDKAELIDFRAVNATEARLRIVNVPSPDRDKLATLAALLRAVHTDGPAIVFVNHRESADRVAAYLDSRHISCVVYHGGLDQQQREMALARFESRAAAVMVATDLAGRGIDITDVATVIHYHPAADVETWTHRNGRTARIDRTGTVYTITAPGEDIAEFVDTENDFYPDMTADFEVAAPMVQIYFDRGKRDKISRGDIAGFLIKQCGAAPERIGKITIGARYALAAVAPELAQSIIATAATTKLKNQRTRVSIVS